MGAAIQATYGYGVATTSLVKTGRLTVVPTQGLLLHSGPTSDVNICHPPISSYILAAQALGEGWKPQDVLRELRRIQDVGEIRFSQKSINHYHVTFAATEDGLQPLLPPAIDDLTTRLSSRARKTEATR